MWSRALVVTVIVFSSLNALSATLQNAADARKFFAKVLNRDYDRYLKYVSQRKEGKAYPYQLTESEAVAVYSYTLDLAHVINPALRAGGEKAREVQPYAALLNGALSKMPKYDGVVVRGTRLLDDVAKTYTKNAVVTDPTFLSTSFGSLRYERDRMNFLSKTGRLIGKFSALPREDEVLFTTDTKFKVLNVAKQTGDHSLYEFEEVIAK